MASPQLSQVISICSLPHAHCARFRRSTSRNFATPASLEGPKEVQTKREGLPVASHTIRSEESQGGVRPRTPQAGQRHVMGCLLPSFFAFLRSGEMTVPSANLFDPSWHLTPMDVAVDNLQQPSLIQLSLKCSKTDQTRQGVKLFIGRTNIELCPVAAMLVYLAVRGFDHGPLFRSEDGQPLTRTKLVSLLKQRLQQQASIQHITQATPFGLGQQSQQQPMESAIPWSRHWEDGLVIPICDTFECHIKPWHSCQRAWERKQYCSLLGAYGATTVGQNTSASAKLYCCVELTIFTRHAAFVVQFL